MIYYTYTIILYNRRIYCNVISVQVKIYNIKSFISYYIQSFAKTIFRQTFLINFRNARINLSKFYLRTDG